MLKVHKMGLDEIAWQRKTGRGGKWTKGKTTGEQKNEETGREKEDPKGPVKG